MNPSRIVWVFSNAVSASIGRSLFLDLPVARSLYIGTKHFSNLNQRKYNASGGNQADPVFFNPPLLIGDNSINPVLSESTCQS